MTTRILRAIDRWRFEEPLALALGASAAFFALTIPAELFDHVPAAGGMGIAGRAIVAVLLAAVCGGAGYVVMRRAGQPAPAAVAVDPLDEIPEEDRPSGMPPERFRRFRRADAHPDAPPREPIIASRDLGEPFMEIGGAPSTTPAAEKRDDDAWWPDTAIPEADFTEIAEETAARPAGTATDEPMAEPVTDDSAPAAPAPETPAEWPLPRTGNSIPAMMERLSAGLERRAATGAADAPPARDMQPAVCGGAGYVVMRRAGQPAPAAVAVDPLDEIPEEDRPSGMPPERFRRFRRADAHPDAPPREPIIASRDLGEPFMEIGGAPSTTPAAEKRDDDAWWPDTAIPEADFTEIAEETAARPAGTATDEPMAEPVTDDSAPAAPAPETPAEWPLPRTGNSIPAMMERLSAGLERRAATGAADAPPARDMQPALRDALEELNRLAARRD